MTFLNMADETVLAVANVAFMTKSNVALFLTVFVAVAVFCVVNMNALSVNYVTVLFMANLDTMSVANVALAKALPYV